MLIPDIYTEHRCEGSNKGSGKKIFTRGEDKQVSFAHLMMSHCPPSVRAPSFTPLIYRMEESYNKKKIIQNKTKRNKK
jgi:hypothetical protein